MKIITILFLLACCNNVIGKPENYSINQIESTRFTCLDSFDCPFGSCNLNTRKCECNSHYAKVPPENEQCNYERKYTFKLILEQLFLGWFGYPFFTLGLLIIAYTKLGSMSWAIVIGALVLAIDKYAIKEIQEHCIVFCLRGSVIIDVCAMTVWWFLDILLLAINFYPDENGIKPG